MRVLIFPCDQEKTAKCYPYWDEVVKKLKEHGDEVIVIRTKQTNKELLVLLNLCDVWCSIDSFAQHFVAYNKLKPGIVIWGKSDPEIFGYATNTNLLKDTKNLRREQFRWWKDEQINESVFIKPQIVFDAIMRYGEGIDKKDV